MCIRDSHSIVDASALAIYSPAGIVVHTGDFKVDYTPVFGDAIDLQRFGEIGKKGVLALMCDSTNAERPGFTMSERTVGKVFDGIMSDHKDSRIIIATVASNVDLGPICRLPFEITPATMHNTIRAYPTTP